MNANLKKLHRKLYLAARSNIHPNYQNDPEAVKALRDYETHRQFHKHYDEMTEKELEKVIEYLNNIPMKRVTVQQLSTLKYYAISVALVYADLKGSYVIDDEVYEGDAIRKLLISWFENHERLPSNIVRHLYEQWINPKCNEFLLQGGYKQINRKPSVFYFEKLSVTEASYLITRFEQIFQNCKNKTQPEVTPWLN